MESLREFPNEVDQIHAEIRSLLQCPLDWEEIIPNSGGVIAYLIDWYWPKIIEGYQIDNEARYLPVDPLLNADILDRPKGVVAIEVPNYDPVELEFALQDDPVTLRADLINIYSWIENARKEYKRNTRRFASMRIATRADYPKHFPPGNLPAIQIRELTKNGKPSLFYPSISAEDLETIMWQAIELCFKEVLLKDYLTVYMKLRQIIGASKGKDTNDVCVKIDCVTPITHIYPILIQELPEGQEILHY